jgi:hypothetical protein
MGNSNGVLREHTQQHLCVLAPAVHRMCVGIWLELPPTFHLQDILIQATQEGVNVSTKISIRARLRYWHARRPCFLFVFACVQRRHPTHSSSSNIHHSLCTCPCFLTELYQTFPPFIDREGPYSHLILEAGRPWGSSL